MNNRIYQIIRLSKLQTSNTKKIYLHIGRHKTGTSSIQNFIAIHPESLSDHALYYPRAGLLGIAHHEFAQVLSFQNTQTDELKQAAVNSDLITTLKAEIDSQDADVLISSEGLQNSNPTLVAQVFAGYEIKTLVYIRNQIDYLASAYAQKIWATSYTDSLESYYTKMFNGDYDTFLARWEKISNGGITIAKFTRDDLHSSDIVVDFFKRMLRIDDQQLTDKIRARDTFDSNPSLTSELLAYKRAYNRCDFHHDDATEKQFRRALARLSLQKASPPVRATEELATSCKEAYRATNQVVAEKYFNGQKLFDMKRPTGQAAQLNHDVSHKISRELISIDSRLESLVTTFMKSAFPVDDAA